jgi:carboxylate-amine ligase
MSSTAPKAVSPFAHRFGAGDEYLVGLEEELLLVDAETYALAPAIERVMAVTPSTAHVKPELLQGQVEIATAPARTSGELLAELVELRAALVHTAGLQRVRVVATGTHPFALAETEPLTARDRYRELAAELRYPLRRSMCCGQHVHVSVGSPDKAMAVVEQLVPFLPLLLAVSASSPFWRGDDTGMASTRTTVFQSMPRSGLPPTFDDYADFAAQLEALRLAGAVADHSRLWWDARPHPVWGTVEVRIMDAQPSAEGAVAVAALVQALVRRLGSAYDRGERPDAAPRAIAAENRWLAARHGLHARFVDPTVLAAVPAREGLRRLLDELADEADALDAGWAFDHLHGVEQTSADRQRLLHRRGAPLPEILAVLAGETAAAPG